MERTNEASGKRGLFFRGTGGAVAVWAAGAFGFAAELAMAGAAGLGGAWTVAAAYVLLLAFWGAAGLRGFAGVSAVFMGAALAWGAALSAGFAPRPGFSGVGASAWAAPLLGAVAGFGRAAWLGRRGARKADEPSELIEQAFHALPVGVRVRRLDGETLARNPSWARMSSAPDVPGDLERRWDAERDALSRAPSGTVRYRRLDVPDDGSGERGSVVAAMRRFYSDALEDHAILSVLIEAAALREHGMEVRENERRLRVALDGAGVGFWEEDPERGAVFRDPNWRRILGWEREAGEDDADRWQASLHPDDRERVLDLRGRLLAGEADSGEIDYRVFRPDEACRWVRERAWRMPSSGERGGKIMGILRDITVQKTGEIDLERARDRAEAADRAKGEFIATVSHEIRTPLNAILGMASLLSENARDEEQEEQAETIFSSGNNLLALLNDMLDFSRIEAGRLELDAQEFPCRACCEEMVRLFEPTARGKGLAFRFEPDETLPDYAFGDMARFKQVVQNLLSNAIKFTEAGEVVLRAAPVEPADLAPENRPDPERPADFMDGEDADYLWVAVRDTGPGVPPDQREAIFEAFRQADASSTRRHGGAGLGLAICRRLVRAMGGRIWVDAAPEGGSIFNCVIRAGFWSETEPAQPASAENRAASGGERVERIAGSHPRSILVLGGGEAAVAAENLLRDMGYAPHRSADPGEGAAWGRRRRYDMVLLELEDRDAALRAARRMAAERGQTRPGRIVGLTGKGGAEAPDAFKLSGIDALVEAPVTAAALRPLIEDSPRGRG